jgi:hypothetical protein
MHSYLCRQQGIENNIFINQSSTKIQDIKFLNFDQLHCSSDVGFVRTMEIMQWSPWEMDWAH